MPLAYSGLLVQVGIASTRGKRLLAQAPLLPAALDIFTRYLWE